MNDKVMTYTVIVRWRIGGGSKSSGFTSRKEAIRIAAVFAGRENVRSVRIKGKVV